MKKIESTPHARGSTDYIAITVVPPSVYPACAGIHLIKSWYLRSRLGLPRMRGDPPGEDRTTEG